MKKNLIIAFLAVSSIFFVFKQDLLLSQVTKGELSTYIGTNLVVPISNPTRIAIGNPVIADVVQVTKKTMTISPKSVGSTTLVLWDGFGEQSYIVNVYSDDTKELKVRIDNVLSTLNVSGVYTKAEDSEGKVFILGRFDNAALKDRVILAMGPLASKTVDLTTVRDDEAVVEIDVQVLELNKGATSKLGFTWPGSISLTEVAGSAPGLMGTSSFIKLFELGNLTRNTYNLTLDALVQEGKARVLSRPRLSCLSGKEAKLLVGGEVPILSSSVVGGGVSGTTATPGSVEYKEYGIKLNIRPTVKENGRIYLNLGVEVSEVGTAVQTNYALAYPFTKRTANTELYLDDGQTMAIGGLIKQKTEEELRKLPWLADVPVLGIFFRQKTTKEGKGYDTRDDSELFITLTPKIVSQGKIKDKKESSIVEAKPLPPPPVVDEATLDPLTRYSKVIQKRIVENITYPDAAKSSSFQGMVKLGIKLSYKGELLETKLIKSSGHKILDDNAIRTARGIPSYPPFPPTIEAQDLWIEVPVVYQLE
ncbi:MAG: TonB family protein [Candidatus Omnitrophica bacterium]|nr:TonB family protein [Candidatus Omnitrophota bacterium]